MNLPPHSIRDPLPTPILNVTLSTSFGPYSTSTTTTPIASHSLPKSKPANERRRKRKGETVGDGEGRMEEEGNKDEAVDTAGYDETFATATTDGWVIYGTWPLRVLGRRVFPSSSLRLVLPHHLSSLLFLVGGPPSPLFPPNKLVLWDDRLSAPVFELEFREEILDVKQRWDKVVVVMRSRVVCFGMNFGLGAGDGRSGSQGGEIWREGEWETGDNPRGLAALSTAPHSTLLVFPGRQAGQLSVVRIPPVPSPPPPTTVPRFTPSQPFPVSQPAYTSTPTSQPPPPSTFPSPPYPTASIVLAHTSKLSALAVTSDGRSIATASKKGTLVRVWDADPKGEEKRRMKAREREAHAHSYRTGNGSASDAASSARRHRSDSSSLSALAPPVLAKELRRGTDTAEIWGIRFSPSATKLAVSSDKGTVHVWDLGDKDGTDEAGGGKGKGKGRDDGSDTKPLNLLKPYLPKYFSSQWSHSQFRLPPPGPPNPRHIPVPTFSGSSSSHSRGSGSGSNLPARQPNPTIEDDICICAWVSVKKELGVDDPSNYKKDRRHRDRSGKEHESKGGERQRTNSAMSRATGTTAAVLAGRSSGEHRRANSTSTAPTLATTKAKGVRRFDDIDPPMSHQRHSTSSPSGSHRPASPVNSLSPPAKQTALYEDQIIAITHSGGWYRISLNTNDGSDDFSLEGDELGASGLSGTSDKEKEKGGPRSGSPNLGLGKDSAKGCRLEEHRRFGSLDGWD